jgi:hypothetical protein
MLSTCFLIQHLHHLSAKKFGCTDFVNPKDHTKPVQEVCSFPSINISPFYQGIDKLVPNKTHCSMLVSRCLWRWPTVELTVPSSVLATSMPWFPPSNALVM